MVPWGRKKSTIRGAPVFFDTSRIRWPLNYYKSLSEFWSDSPSAVQCEVCNEIDGQMEIWKCLLTLNRRVLKKVKNSIIEYTVWTSGNRQETPRKWKKNWGVYGQFPPGQHCWFTRYVVINIKLRLRKLSDFSFTSCFGSIQSTMFVQKDPSIQWGNLKNWITYNIFGSTKISRPWSDQKSRAGMLV